MNFEQDNNDSELHSLMQQNENVNVVIPAQTGRMHPLPHDTNKHFAWGIYKKKTSKERTNKERRPTCRRESYNNFKPPPPPPPPAPAIMAYGGKIKKRVIKQTKKHKYTKKSKSKSKSKSNRYQKKTIRYKNINNS